ncbi:MAG TPA: protein translocase subunit SecF [Thermomicrobiales bacterium]|nr:protein translocase subunit SecF [Thermomicrobiales bacterium]
MIDLVSKRYLFFLISGIILLPGVVSLVFNGLAFGIDFTGGTSWELQLQQRVTTAEVRDVLSEFERGDSVIQLSGDDVVLIRTRELPEGSAEKQEIAAALQERFGEYEELQIATVGPTVGQQIRNRAAIAVGLASVGVLLYIAWAFRNTNNPLLYGVCAIVAMLHDVLLLVGLFSILGWVANVEVDALFVTALLTVIGFSVHDTIVVFDRIRENLARRVAPTFAETVNYSIVQTLVRSVNTSVTVVLTLLALYLFGGASIRWFVLTLLVGVIAGTYSSIFNASQLLVAWENGEIQRLFRRGRGPEPRARTA